MTDIIPVDSVIYKIYEMRGYKVMLDRDLSLLYKVETRILNQAVKRNIERFPSHYMFQLTKNEFESLRSQIVTLEIGRGKHPKYLPYAFTEHGILMLSSVLNSSEAIKINIKIIDVFIQLRKSTYSLNDLKNHLKLLSEKVDKHDAQIKNIIDAVNFLIAENSKPKLVVEKSKKPMGFKVNNS